MYLSTSSFEILPLPMSPGGGILPGGPRPIPGGIMPGGGIPGGIPRPGGPMSGGRIPGGGPLIGIPGGGPTENRSNRPKETFH